MPNQSWFGASVYYSNDGYNTSGSKLMGRQAAGQGFLRAYVQAAQAKSEQASAWVTSHTTAAVRAAQEGFEQAGLRTTLQVMTPATMVQLQNSGCLYVPQPGLHELAWQRARVGERRYSLCGVTHTTASHAVMDTLADLPTSPLRPWDAVICTSTSVLDTVKTLVGRRMEFLRWKLGASQLELPQLPVIPLGVHVSDFRTTEQERAAARQSLNMAPDDVVVLFVGRLSFHAKAHPHPMFSALQSACTQEGKRVHLVQAGWYANDAIEAAFNEAAKVLAPSVVHHHLDARDPASRRQAWACADIFCSLSDNIQETFGLTPIEAMAAGLPVVVSDWDGYKDTVRDGVDGFRVRTWMPPAGDGEDLAALYERGLDNYDIYCGKSCEFVAVDIPHAAQALGQLIANPSLRKRMGQSGQQRAEQVFDWSVVMRQYEQLWSQLADRRKGLDTPHAQPDRMPCARSPARLDPFDLYSGYPTHVLSDTTTVTLSQPVDPALYAQTTALGIHKYASAVLPTWPQVQSVLTPLSASPLQVKDLYGQANPAERKRLRRQLLWMVKVGWLSVAA